MAQEDVAGVFVDDSEEAEPFSGHLNMYQAHFHIKENPFALTPDPRYLFMSRQHQEALAHLLYGMTEGGGFVQLTGEVGTGKTTLCRSLVEQVPNDVDIALILNPKQTAVELVASICDELRIDYPQETESLKVLVDRLNRFLLENHAKGRRTALIIDEAQNLSSETLEQIRLLTNLETTTRKLLQIILIGQPELRNILARREMRQLDQRITARYHLLPLSRRATIAYVRHRLEVSGLKEQVFTPGALRLVSRLSGGVPRRINIICDRALLGAYAKKRERVSGSLVREASFEVRGRRNAAGFRRVGGFAVAALVLVLLGIGWNLLPRHFSKHPLNPGKTGDEISRAVVVPQSPDLKDLQSQPKEGAPEIPAVLPDTSMTGGMGGTRQTQDRETEKNAPKTRPSSFSELRREGRIRTDKASAFMTLFRCWNEEYGMRVGKDACERASARGLRCMRGKGTWMMIKQFQRPAILELIDESKKTRYVTVTGMGDSDVTLGFMEREYILPRAEIDRYWFGSFVLLWRPPRLSRRLLKEGTSGPDVNWLRKQLARVQGLPTGGESGTSGPVFDGVLKKEVMAFQREHGLIADGMVGERTLIQLNTALQEPGIPLLELSNQLIRKPGFPDSR